MTRDEFIKMFKVGDKITYDNLFYTNVILDAIGTECFLCINPDGKTDIFYFTDYNLDDWQHYEDKKECCGEEILKKQECEHLICDMVSVCRKCGLIYEAVAKKNIDTEIKKLVEVLISIHEYWNRDNNEKAMEDACWHTVETSEQILKEKGYI